MTEQMLLEAVKRGDRAALHELYSRYSGHVTTVCRRYLTDEESVRDTIQDCFVKVFTSVGRFHYRGEGSLRAWVTRIAANESLSQLRQAVRFEEADNIPDEPDEGEVDVGAVPMPVMMEMIRALPAGYRTVFNLYLFEGMSHKEIAGQLGISASTSATQYLRARRMLERKITEYRKKTI